MRHNRPWEEPWYDRHAREKNPLRKDFTSIGSDLESSVIDASTGSNYGDNGFTRWARIGSSFLLATYMILITACGGQIAPTPSPTSTAQRTIPTLETRQTTPQPTLEARVKAIATSTPSQPQIPVSRDKPTYDVIFPFKAPSNDMEKAILRTTDVVTYMKFIRAQNNFDLNVTLAKIVRDFFGRGSISTTTKTINDYRQSIESGKLNEAYVSPDTIRIYLNSLPTNQTRIEALPRYFQQTANGDLIPLSGDLVMDSQIFLTLKNKYSNPFVAFALSNGLSEEVINKLYIFSKDGSLQDVDRRIISILAKSHPEVQRVLSDQLMEKGSTPFGRVPADFNYSSWGIKEVDPILGPFEEMVGMPFVEGKNVLFFYRPTYDLGRGEKLDTKKFLESNEVIKLLDIAYNIQTELVGYRPYGNQKRLFLHSYRKYVEFHLSSDPYQPVTTPLTTSSLSDPLRKMLHSSVPDLMGSYLTLISGLDPSRPFDLLTRTSMGELAYLLTIEELLDAHMEEFNPRMRESLIIWRTDMINNFAKDRQYSGIDIIHKVGENQEKDFYKNFFRIWNNVQPYVNANPGVINGQYPYTNFFGSDVNGERINDAGLVSNTLIISSLSAAAGKDLRQQFSQYREIPTHQGLFDKTLPFFRSVLDYSRNTQK